MGGGGLSKGNIMQKYTQNQRYVGPSGQILTTNVSMTLANSSPNPCLMWLHYVWYQMKIRSHINTVPTTTVGWTRAQLIQEGGGGTTGLVCHSLLYNPPHRVQCIQCSPGIPFDVVPLCLSMFFVKKYEIVVLRGGFSDGFSRRFRDFPTIFPATARRFPHNYRSLLGLGGKGNLRAPLHWAGGGGGLVPSAASEGPDSPASGAI